MKQGIEKSNKSDLESLEEQFLIIQTNFENEKEEYKKDLENIQKIKEEMSTLTIEIEELEKLESLKNNQTETLETTKEKELKIEKTVEEAVGLVEKENDQIIEDKFIQIQEETKGKDLNKKSLSKRVLDVLSKQFKKRIIKYLVLPATVATTIALSYHNPEEYYGMYQNYKERHLDKYNVDDPNIIGINALYNDSTDVEKTTYDFIGDHKIEYKGGYYMTSVFDLSDRTPPRFKLINDRENYTKIDSAAGITTNLFKKFYKFSEFSPKLKGHLNKSDEEIGEISVIGYNPKTQLIHAGHYKEFNDDWLISETYEIPLNFKLNNDSTINLTYHDQAMRMVPLSTNAQGKQIPFPIGITYNRNINKIKPSECTHFGTLEGGKVIMVCGDKQLQVNGSFADMFKVYERLKKEYKGKEIEAYLLDNGSYNLPIWNNNKDSVLTPQEIRNHLFRNYDGGTALVLISDGRISPYEYKNKYKEYEHYTPNYTRDSITGKPAKNQKLAIVLHHTGNYDNSNDIIKEFENPKAGLSAHILIMKDGTRHIFNNDNYVLAHAGKSDFNNRNKVNYFSIGIELEGDTRDHHQFTVAQVESLLECLRPRVEKYNIPLEDITTHKIIRDNYIKKHPNEKNVPAKPDLDDLVWKQLRDLIQKKIYKNKPIKLTNNAQKMVGALAYQDGYHKTKKSDYSIAQTKKILAKYNVPGNNINQTTDWIRNRV